MTKPDEQFQLALLQPRIGVAFAWSEEALVQLELVPVGLSRGRVYGLKTDGAERLYALEVLQSGSAQWPASLTSGGQIFVRLMDRLYLPAPRDRATTIAVFDACASVYEALIDVRRNVRNISRLLDVIEARQQHSVRPIRVLDFGCGTGLCLQAVAEHPKPGSFLVHGLDGSQHMRSIAAHRGVLLVSGNEMEQYDGILASYVLHGGVVREDLESIARSLTNRGVFAANWLHGDQANMEGGLGALASVRLGNGSILWERAVWPNDPIIVFQVDERR